MHNLIARVYNSIRVCILIEKIFSLKCTFFLYEKFQSQVGNKVVCQEMDPYSKPFYSFIYFLEKEKG